MKEPKISIQQKELIESFIKNKFVLIQKIFPALTVALHGKGRNGKRFYSEYSIDQQTHITNM